MTIRSILTCDFGGPRDNAGNSLRRTSSPVNWSIDSVPEMLSDLRDTFYASKISVGLAAVQIGILKRMFIANPNKSETAEELLAINPIVLDARGSNEKMMESCMSIPNRRGPVKRRTKVTLQYSDELGNSHQREFVDFFARIVLHEMDHLDGVLCLDHVGDPSLVQTVDFFDETNYPAGSVDGSLPME